MYKMVLLGTLNKKQINENFKEDERWSSVFLMMQQRVRYYRAQDTVSVDKLPGTENFFSLISNTAGGYCFYRMQGLDV